LGEAVQKEAAAEVGGVMAADELDGFLRKYVAAYVDRHAGISMSDILAAIGKPVSQEESSAIAVDALHPSWRGCSRRTSVSSALESSSPTR
jgi:hypothetical protein